MLYVYMCVLRCTGDKNSVVEAKELQALQDGIDRGRHGQVTLHNIDLMVERVKKYLINMYYLIKNFD